MVRIAGYRNVKSGYSLEVATNILNSRAVIRRGEFGWKNPQRKKEYAKCKEYHSKNCDRKGGKLYQKRIEQNRKYESSAGIFPYRRWEEWEINFLRTNKHRGCRELALALGRSVKSILVRRNRL